MDRGSVPRPARRNQSRKRTRRRAGLAIIERDGFWHVHGTVIAKGRHVRVRKSTGLQARPEHWEEADGERLRIETEIRGELRGEVGSGSFLSVAAELYLTQPRTRPIGRATIAYVQAAVRQFGLRRLGDIRESEWASWVEQRCRGTKSASRERLLNSILAFLNWCARKPRRWGTVPALDRDKEARNPRRRARRPVHDLSIELLEHLIAHASSHLAAQIWTEWSTGARVSSILHGCRLSDLILAPGREQITFHATKNGETVTAHLHPRAARALTAYLEARGRLHDREGPLFLTHHGKAYSANSFGVQNRTAFTAMKRRARRALREAGMQKARHLAETGQSEAAVELVAKLRANHRLLGRITQHWFRHLLATRMRGDIRAAMDQGGWIDERSVMGYTIDVPEHRRRLVNELDKTPEDTSLTRGAGVHKKS
jgi:site-specific recombinase XerC